MILGRNAALVGLSLLFTGVSIGAPAEDWSWKILERMATTSQPAHARPASQEGFVLRIHICPENRDPAPLAPLLERLLPAGATLRTLEDGKRFAVLAPQEAQHALAELLLTLEEIPAQAAPNPGISPELLASLERLVDGEPAQLAALESLKSEFSARLDALQAPERAAPIPPPIYLAGGLILLAPTLLLFRKRRSQPLALAPLQPAGNDIAGALLPETRRQTEDIKLALVELGQNLHTALSLRSAQLSGIEERVNQLESSGNGWARGQEALDGATRTLEGTAERLTRENDRVLALAGELRGTLNELDTARDRLRLAEETLSEKDAALVRRNAELEHERAKLAALSMILERMDSAPAKIPPPPIQSAASAGTPAAREGAAPAFRLLPPSQSPS